MSRCVRLRMVTVKSRVQRRPKFTYIVAPLSRTDKTLPSTSAKWPRVGAESGKIFGSQRGEIGVGPQPAFGAPGLPFGRQKGVGAGFTAGRGGNARRPSVMSTFCTGSRDSGRKAKAASRP